METIDQTNYPYQIYEYQKLFVFNPIFNLIEQCYCLVENCIVAAASPGNFCRGIQKVV
jgi:hypothetical protein